MASDSQPPVCGLDGNPDLTGLGVRSAFYIQTISFAIAGDFLDAEAGYLHSSTIGLLLAILVALLRETIRGSLFAPEVAVVMWLFTLQLVASVGTVRKTVPSGDKRVSVAEWITLRLHVVLILALIGYQAWFWFVGLDSLPRTACTEWTFFFTKVDVRGWSRTLDKIAWGMVCSACGLYILFKIIRGTVRYIRGTTREQETMAPETLHVDETRSNTPDNAQPFLPPVRVALTSTFILLAALKACVFLGMITISVELQIRWNEIRHVQSLDSVGQLVPFIMALGQLVHVAYCTIRGKDTRHYSNWIEYAVVPRLRKRATGPVALSLCPKTGNHQLDEEHHEMIPAAEDVASRESIDTASDDGELHGPGTYANLAESPPANDIYLVQIGSPPSAAV